jgi:sec-independent protein translocase protein TatA
MGLDNPIHIAFLLVILLLVFGARRLPEMGQSLGHGLRGFKDALTGDRTSEQRHDLPAAPVSVLTDEQHDAQRTPTSSAV